MGIEPNSLYFLVCLPIDPASWFTSTCYNQLISARVHVIDNIFFYCTKGQEHDGEVQTRTETDRNKCVILSKQGKFICLASQSELG